MNVYRILMPLLAGLMLTLSASAQMKRSPSPEGAVAYIISPAHGETVPTTFTVRFGLKGMGIAPAGIELPNTGHHHLLIDMDKMPKLDMPMPASEKLVHFGKGQTEAEVTLTPGTHTLQLVLGDHLHIPHNPVVASQTITITVK